MEHTSNSFHRKLKAANPSFVTKIIAVVLFVLVIASLVFYLRSKNITREEDSVIVTTPTAEEEKSIVGEFDEKASPESVDLGMVENDLNEMDKNLDTVDKLEDF